MGFLDTLRSVLGGAPANDRSPVKWPLRAELGLDGPAASAAVDADASAYDREQWRKKLKRILDELPGSRPEWDDLITEARALGFPPAWVASCQVEEFLLLIRRAVSDRLFTEEEHRKLELARNLIGLSESEAEDALRQIVAEAEAFFGKPIQES